MLWNIHCIKRRPESIAICLEACIGEQLVPVRRRVVRSRGTSRQARTRCPRLVHLPGRGDAQPTAVATPQATDRTKQHIGVIPGRAGTVPPAQPVATSFAERNRSNLPNCKLGRPAQPGGRGI